MSTPAFLTTQRSSDTLLRGIAILSVLIIHVLANFPPGSYTTAWYQPLVLVFDQLSRSCVPMFVALSGYGLMQKYKTVEFTWKEFLQRRVWKLFPLYAAWSLIFYLIFLFTPFWRSPGVTENFFKQLFLGQADYHLYFVPMIFQFYLLFPFLMKLHNKNWGALLAVTGIFQFCLYLYFQKFTSIFPTEELFSIDQHQYIWFITWIFYFVLGMSLSKIHEFLKNEKVLLCALLALCASWIWTVANAQTSIFSGIDPVVATRFTRIPILFYATFDVIFFTYIFQKFPIPFTKALSTLGKHSFGIYLSHTLFLRIVVTAVRFFF